MTIQRLMVLVTFLGFCSNASAASQKLSVTKIEEFRDVLIACDSEENVKKYTENFPKWKKESPYGSVNGNSASTLVCYKNLFSDIAATFYSEKQKQANAEFEQFVSAVYQGYNMLYLDSDKCPEHCGRIAFDLAAGEANAAIAKFISQTLDFIEQTYSY